MADRQRDRLHAAFLGSCDDRRRTPYVPHVPDKLFNDSMKLSGLDLDDILCYLPMIIDDRVIGVLAVWGKELRKEDTPAMTRLS